MKKKKMTRPKEIAHLKKVIRDSYKYLTSLKKNSLTNGAMVLAIEMNRWEKDNEN